MRNSSVILSEFLNPKNRISTFKVLVLFTGSHDKAAVLNQLYYWSNGRTKIDGGWVAKTYDEWYDEVLVSKKVIRSLVSDLKNKGVLETKTKKFKGYPTVHYRFDLEKFNDLLIDFIDAGMPRKKQKARGCASPKTPDSALKEQTPDSALKELSDSALKELLESALKERIESALKEQSIYIDYTDTTTKITLTEITSVFCSRNLKIDFDFFYNSYPRKVSKTPARKKWDKLTNEERQEAINSLPKYIKSIQGLETRFILHPSTFLNQERWNDEFEDICKSKIPTKGQVAKESKLVASTWKDSENEEYKKFIEWYLRSDEIRHLAPNESDFETLVSGSVRCGALNTQGRAWRITEMYRAVERLMTSGIIQMTKHKSLLELIVDNTIQQYPSYQESNNQIAV